MKTTLLFLVTFLTISLYSQNFCTYNSDSNINFGENSIDEPFETFELEDGKFIIVGTTYISSWNSFRMAACRMNADNTIDETFGYNGRIQFTWDDRNTGISAALQSDEKILVGGYQAPGNGVSGFRPYVGRLGADGLVDTDFGIDGSSVLEIESAIKGSVIGIKQLEDGKILAAAITSGPAGFALIRLMADGTYDTTFNGSGHILHEDSRVVWQVDYGEALYLSDGSVVIVTKTFSDGITKGLISKLNSDGSLDQNFGVNGTVELTTPIQFNFAGIHAVIDSEENILIATTSGESPKRYQVTKVFSATGIVDSDFGDDGTATSTYTANLCAVHGITLNPANGDVLVVGSGTTTNWNHSIWRLDSSGNEQDVCGDGAFYTFPVDPNNGLRVANFFSDGSLKLIGEGYNLDPTNPDITTQNRNWSVLQFTDPLSINELDQYHVSIYPNPATDVLNIGLDNATLKSIRIRNQLGQIVLSISGDERSMDISNLKSGVYFAEIDLGETRAVRKLIKP